MNEDISISNLHGALPLSSGTRNELKTKRVELVVRCQELARFLRGFDEFAWAEWIEQRIREIRGGGSEDVERLLDGYQGVGNIGDVFLCPEAGHKITVPDENGVNEQFLVMLSKVNALARHVQALSCRPVVPRRPGLFP